MGLNSINRIVNDINSIFQLEGIPIHIEVRINFETGYATVLSMVRNRHVKTLYRVKDDEHGTWVENYLKGFYDAVSSTRFYLRGM